MGKLPAFQFYPADWRKDLGVQSLSYHDRGVWFEMLCLMHESEDRGRLVLNGEPMPGDALARILGLDTESLGETIQRLLNAGVASRDASGALVCRRMLRDEQIRRERAVAGQIGGARSARRRGDAAVKQNSHIADSPTASANDRGIVTPPAKTRRGCRLPDDFAVTDQMRAWAREKRPMVNLDFETEKFVNYWRAESGRHATKLDWVAAWRKWILSARPTVEISKYEQKPSSIDRLRGQFEALSRYPSERDPGTDAGDVVRDKQAVSDEGLAPTRLI
jgi:hypothetical protein